MSDVAVPGRELAPAHLRGYAGTPRLTIDDLDVSFATDHGDVAAVNGVSLYVDPGEILAIVGESGSGKTVTARSILGLLPETATAKGVVLVSGTNVVGLSGAKMRAVRGRDVSMVFQEPSSALNPVYPIWWQMAEGLRAHNPTLKKAELRAQAIESLRKVGMPDPEHRIDRYPHEFSGGQKQRIMIAMALAMGAELIVADEPTTALDVTVQAEILQLLRDVRDQFGTSIVLITHNMGVVADLADSVAVMYAGRIVEVASVTDLFRQPRHAYTLGLLNSIPGGGASRRPLMPIPGAPPDLSKLPPGCPFAPRCAYATEDCLSERPPLQPVGMGRQSACIHHATLAKPGEQVPA